jgi:hypothetical protein
MFNYEVGKTNYKLFNAVVIDYATEAEALIRIPPGSNCFRKTCNAGVDFMKHFLAEFLANYFGRL